LGDVPVYLHASDREWVVRPDSAQVFWDGDSLRPLPGVTLIRCGGHFAGGTVLHWADGADGLGALLSGDILMVSEDRRTVSCMYSYPNYIPLDPETVQRVGAAVEPFEFEQIYGGWFGRNVRERAKQAVRYSVRRYVGAIGRQATG
jgi:glyoxylase-like metal-dependent hydrolase (beta-lactamase superfamily II)